MLPHGTNYHDSYSHHDASHDPIVLQSKSAITRLYAPRKGCVKRSRNSGICLTQNQLGFTPAIRSPVVALSQELTVK